MATLFDLLIAGVAHDVAMRRARVPMHEMILRAQNSPLPRPAHGVLQKPGCAVIAEIKRANPTHGRITRIDNIKALAQQLEIGGATMLSCQTESRGFHGSLNDLAEVSSSVNIPVMSKDFIIDPYQIHEARFYGADMVPLLAAVLTPSQLESLIERVRSLGMAAMVEVHDEAQAAIAVEVGARIIGVNARNLTDYSIDRDKFERIAPGLPADVTKVALSGVRTPQDLLAYAAAGADAVVIGEGIVTSGSPWESCRRFVAAGQHPACPSKH